MSLEVGIVGLPGTGKSTLFTALTGAAAEQYGTAHVGMAAVPDDRLAEVARIVGSPKATQAAIRIVDLPGTASAQLGSARAADALVGVVSDEAQLESLQLELLVADRDHVERRLEKVRKDAKSGDPKLRVEVDELERVLAHLDAERPLGDYGGVLPPELEPLTTKPLVPVVNGPGGIDLKLEAELAELAPEEAAAFRDGEPSALDELVRRLQESLDLLTFFTANENEARAWTLRRGQTALDAAGTIHTDMARGFIRCEVVHWRDLSEAGSRAEASRRGLQRLEGKEYVVEDGDLLNVRFNV
jgi:ribosome-binding ATPase YchF (GTP1/OBG family)